MEKKLYNSVMIVGPTACGKTSLAVKLSEKYGGEIISADSRQVYKGLDLGSGKDLGEYGYIEYHLIDVASPMGKGVEGSRLVGRPQRPLQTVGGRVAPRRSPDGGARPAC